MELEDIPIKSIKIEPTEMRITLEFYIPEEYHEFLIKIIGEDP